jgi:hypothetical protein
MPVTARGASGFERAGTVVAAGISLATIGAVMVSLLAWIARSMADMPVSFGRTPVGVLGLVLSPIFYAAVGGILAGRVRSNVIGWLFLVIGASLGMMLPVNVLVSTAHESLQPAGTLVVWAAWFRTAFGTPVVLTAAVIAVQLFPDGAPLPGRWKIGIWWGLATGGLLLLTTAIDPVGLVTYPSIPNPLALPYEDRAAVAAGRTLGVVGILVAAGVAIASLWLRYQRGGAILRAQLRWIVLAVVVTVAGAVPFVVARYVLRVTDDTGELLSAIAQVGSCAFPLAAALAISRYRLFDVDVVISRTLVYLPLMAILGGMYTAGIALVQRLFVALTGSESDAAIVLTVLIVASVFTPLRRSLEATVDRRFSGGQPDERQGSEARTSVTEPLLASQPGSVGHLRHVLQRVHLAPVAPDDTVTCPLRRPCRLRDCLQCRYLVGIDDSLKLTVVCNPGAQ